MPQFLHCRLSATGVAVPLLLFGVCLTLSLSAPAQVVDSSAQAAGKYTLSGTVINSATGEGIPHAMVEIAIGTRRAMLTGLDGRFEFTEVPATEVTVSAHKPGFFTEQDLGSMLAARPLVARVGPDAAPVVIKLIPQAVISGHVESAGAPLEDIPVKLLTSGIEEGRRRWEQPQYTVTDEDGNFRISGLRPGSYYVEAGPGLEFDSGISVETDAESASGPGKAAIAKENPPKESQAEKETGYPAMFYPAAPDPSTASPIALAAGDQGTANFSLKSAPVFRVSGVIVGLGEGGREFIVESEAGEILSVPNILDAHTGKFAVKVPPGRYTLQVGSQAPDGQALQARSSLDVTSNRAGIRMVLLPQPSIPVDVRLESASPNEFARLPDPGGPARVHLIPRSASVRATDYWSSGGREGPGTIALIGVDPGTYSVQFITGGAWHVQSAECGGVDLLRDDLTIVSGAQTPPVEIVLRNDSATLNGSVTLDGQPVTAAVLAVPQNAPRQTAIAIDNAGTEFQFENLAPGDYSIFAVDNLDGLEYSDPATIEPYLAKAKHVTLQPNEKTSVNLEVLETGN
jgi:Carboxypeptidase regulatory-like domain